MRFGERISYTLVHGDLHLANVALHQEQIIVYDWTDGCIAHPFFDALVISDGNTIFPDIPDAQERLRKAYLEQWTAYETAHRLEEALEIGYVLGDPHQVITYHRLFDNSEPVWQTIWREGLIDCVRKLLKRLEPWEQL